MEVTIENDQHREQRKEHSLYKNHTKQDLEFFCKKSRITVTFSLSKHTLVRLITENRNESIPPCTMGNLLQFHPV